MLSPDSLAHELRQLAAGVETTPQPEQDPAASLRFLTPAELRAQVPAQPRWLWDGYLAVGALTIGPAGKPKVGKSTLAFAVIDAITAGAASFLGRPVTQAGVVYLSEEGGSTLLSKLPADRPNLHILTRDNAWPRPSWPDLVTAAVAHAQAVGAELLVVDTFPFWSALATDREKDAGAVQEAVEPLVQATREGLAVMLPTHTRKAGGEDGDAIRGSSALAGAGDVLLELERPGGQNVQPGQRLLVAIGRYPQTPAALLVEYEPNTTGWQVIGESADRRDSQLVSERAALLGAIGSHPGGATRKQIEQHFGAWNAQISKQIDDLVASGEIAKTGKGRKGNPYIWKLCGEAVQGEHSTHSNPAQGGSFSGVCVVDAHQKETRAGPRTQQRTPPETLLDRASDLEARWEAQSSPGRLDPEREVHTESGASG